MSGRLIRARLVLRPDGSVPQGALETSEDGELWTPVLVGARDDPRPAVWGRQGWPGLLATSHAVLLAAHGVPPEPAAIAVLAGVLSGWRPDQGWTIDADQVHGWTAGAAAQSSPTPEAVR